MTKDERFLIHIYQTLQSAGDEERILNPYVLAKELGYKDLLIKDIVKGLRQANLIKVYSPEEIALTERGKEVARSLLT